jgi:hypothetical protein
MPHPDLAQIEAEIEHLAPAKQILLIERLAKRLRQEFFPMISPSGENRLHAIELMARSLGKRIHQVTNPLEDALDAMAADPDLQRELRLIESEFQTTEQDGLGEFE